MKLSLAARRDATTSSIVPSDARTVMRVVTSLLQPEAVDPVEALQEAASGEVAVHVDGVMALVVQADALPQRCRVGQQHHAVRVRAKALDLLVAIGGAAVHHGGAERCEYPLQGC